MEIDIKRLKIALADKCYSLADLSREAKLGTSTLYKILHNKSSMNTRTLGKIAKALDVKATDLLKDY